MLKISTKHIVSIFIIIYSICITIFFDSSQRNIGLVVFTTLSLFIFLMIHKVSKAEYYLFPMIMFMFLFTFLYHDSSSMRASSLLYSCMYILGHLCFLRALYVSNYSLFDLQRLCKNIIFAYTFVLLIQQISLLVGIPPINNFGESNPELLRFNSLALEPSWAGRIVGLLMFIFLVCQTKLITGFGFKNSFLQERVLWLAFFWVSITTFSGTAILFMIAVLSLFIDLRKNILVSVIMMLIVCATFEILEVEQFMRLKTFFIAVATMDPLSIIHADHSASFRVVPFILTPNYIDISSLNTWFGNGIDFTANIDWGLGAPAGNGMFQLLLDYGIFPFLIYLIFTLKTCFLLDKPISVIFWFLLVFLYGLNVQIPWLALMLFTTYKFALRKYQER